MKWLSLLLLVCVAAPLWAADLNWDDRVTRGQLENGLKYIQENAEPEARMELRLVCCGFRTGRRRSAGSGPLCRNMALTERRIQELELVNYLESLAGFGADLGYTVLMKRFTLQCRW